MRITQDKEFKLWLPETKGRSEGIHLTDILRDLDTLFRKPEEDGGLGVDPQYALRGFAWEAVLSQSFAAQMIPEHEWVSQLELCVDTPIGPVYMTTDGLMHLGRLREFKACEKTSKKLNPDVLTPEQLIGSFKLNFRTWDWQIQCYLRALGILECELYVWWVRGDYSFGGDRRTALERRTCKYLLTYEQYELDETWTMVVNHAMTMRAKGRL